MSAADEMRVREMQRLRVGELLAGFERAWGAIRVNHAEVPPVVLALGTGSGRRAARRKLGHFATARWSPVHEGVSSELRTAPPAVAHGDVMAELASSAQPLLLTARLLSWDATMTLSEVVITADGLAGSPTDVMGTLVHEAAHALVRQRDIKDSSRQGRYHNQRFKALAEELGLTVRRDPELGWSQTALSTTAAIVYRDSLAQLADCLRVDSPDTLRSTAVDRPAARSRIALVCECGRRVRTGRTRSTVNAAICGVCCSGVTTLEVVAGRRRSEVADVHG